MNPTSKLNPLAYLKAIAGAIVAGLGVLYVALSDDMVTAQEAVAIVTAILTTFVGVWGTPNAPTKETVSKSTITVESTQVDAPKVENDGPDHRAEV